MNNTDWIIGNESRLNAKVIFAMATWPEELAFKYLAGLSDWKDSLLGPLLINGESLQSQNDRVIIQNNVDRYRHAWKNNPAHPDKAPPSTFIEWAIGIDMPPPWLEQATKSNLYVPVAPEIKTNIVNSTSENPLARKTETSYLNIIGALVHIILVGKNSKTAERFSSINTQNELIDLIHDNFLDNNGLSTSNLEKKFLAAKDSLRSSK